ncbi:hypothetical protein R3P38DRAFT_2803566 [Favolaschia claudopus]|uniref:Uncharacterized protein n=1 Tax=Favolaschia claudopus TaxID=2862362 RepID=A0AAV9ZTN0_9AGAR
MPKAVPINKISKERGKKGHFSLFVLSRDLTDHLSARSVFELHLATALPQHPSLGAFEIERKNDVLRISGLPSGVAAALVRAWGDHSVEGYKFIKMKFVGGDAGNNGTSGGQRVSNTAAGRGNPTSHRNPWAYFSRIRMVCMHAAKGKTYDNYYKLVDTGDLYLGRENSLQVLRVLTSSPAIHTKEKIRGKPNLIFEVLGGMLWVVEAVKDRNEFGALTTIRKRATIFQRNIESESRTRAEHSQTYDAYDSCMVLGKLERSRGTPGDGSAELKKISNEGKRKRVELGMDAILSGIRTVGARWALDLV